MIKRFLTTTHRWLGFPVGILFIITFGTGFITAIDELYGRISPTEKTTDKAFQQITIDESSVVLSGITQGKKGLSSIMMPTKDTPYYQLTSRSESWTYHLDHPKVAEHQEKQNNEFFKTVLQLHRNFLLGKSGIAGISGNQIVAWVGLIALIISLIGLWIWWSKRRLFNIADVLPRGRKRKNLYGNHTSAGAICIIAIIILALTGAGITYRTFTKELLGVSKNTNIKSKANTTLGLDYASTIEKNWHAWLTVAYGQMPEGSILMKIKYPRKKNNKVDAKSSKVKTTQTRKIPITENKNNRYRAKVLTFQFNSPNDWLGLAQSHVSIDINKSYLVSTTLFSQLSLGEKTYAMLKPLHTGHGLPIGYVIVQFILSLLGTIMVCSGVIMFINKKRKKSWLPSFNDKKLIFTRN